jgi:hypothetical protein
MVRKVMSAEKDAEIELLNNIISNLNETLDYWRNEAGLLNSQFTECLKFAEVESSDIPEIKRRGREEWEKQRN